LWVTINGKRVPSSSLRINPENNVSILSIVLPDDTVMITSMMPSATPNEEIYLQNVNKNNVQTIFRTNANTRTWLTQPLQNVDTIIYVEDVTKVTENIVQIETAPAPVDGIISIGLEGDKRIITQVIVQNGSTTLPSTSYYVDLENIAPVLRITNGVSGGNTITITVILGNLIYINGEQIRFTTVDFDANTLSGLQRGANGTGEQTYIPQYITVYGILSTNQLPAVYNGFSWNSFNYNLVDGDPLQISTTYSANFLNADVP
jgi:hypothetical protein